MFLTLNLGSHHSVRVSDLDLKNKVCRSPTFWIFEAYEIVHKKYKKNDTVSLWDLATSTKKLETHFNQLFWIRFDQVSTRIFSIYLNTFDDLEDSKESK